MAFASSAAPIPLYDIYHRKNGVTYSDLSLTAVVYFIGAVTALLVFGRISNHLGRKISAFIVLFLSALSCLCLIYVNSATPLIIGRFLLGLSCGLASSSIAAYVVDTAPEKPEWLSAAIVSNMPMVGLTIGALSSGILVEYGPYSRTLCYLVALTGIAISAVLIAFSKETIKPRSGILASLRPRIILPQSDRRLYPVAACIFVGTWAMGGFFQAYGPSIAAEQLGTLSAFAAALVFSSYLLPAALGGPLAAYFTPANAQRLGMVVFTVAASGLLVSMKMSSIIGFLVLSTIAGMAQGAVLTGSVRSLLADVSTPERAGVLSLIFATSYTGAAIPSYIAGRLSGVLNLFELTVCYVALACAISVITLFFARNPQHVHVNGQEYK